MEYNTINTLYINQMQEEAKLIVAEQYDKQKIQFIIYNNVVFGEGGFGVVKKAIRNDRPNQQLAAKIIPYEDQLKKDKIQKQISVLRKLPPHPNLVRVEPLKCYSSNNYYIFMEYCPGGTLDDLRKKKKNKFTQQEIFQIFYQLMNGYRVLYDAKILHEDLKLENVLIKDGLYKITDFGFSIFYQGVMQGSIRQGTLPYMPIQKLTVKQYKASTKSDVYAMGIMLFKLITGHHPYVQSKNKNCPEYVKQLKVNPLYLRPNFSSKFSIKFQHFFDLVLKMVAKSQSARIDFDTVYDYIKNQEMFEAIHQKIHGLQKIVNKNQYQKFMIVGESEAIAINFNIPESEQHKVIEQIEINNKNQQQQQQQKIIKQLQRFIVSHRIIVYFFDRLTRRIYIQKIKNQQKYNSKQKSIIEQLNLGLLLFCKKITQMLLKQCKTGIKYPLAHWRIYRKNNTGLLKMIQRDQTYLQDLVIDCLSQSSQTKIIEKKEMLDRSKLELNVFRKFIKQKLENLYEIKSSGINTNNRQNLITICYIRSGMEILIDFQKWQKDAVDLESYFRQIQTEDSSVLFEKVTGSFMEKNIEPTFEISEQDGLLENDNGNV